MTRKIQVRTALLVAALFTITVGAPAGAASTAQNEQAEAGKPLKLVRVGQPQAKAVKALRKAKVASHRRVKPHAVASRKPKKDVVAQAAISPDVANAKAEMTQKDDMRVAAEITAPATPSADVANSEAVAAVGQPSAVASENGEPRSIRTELVTEDQPQTALPVTVADNNAAQPQAELQQTVGQTEKPVASVAASGDAWAQSSLIGKIFIAFGGLLTLASAARMLIA